MGVYSFAHKYANIRDIYNSSKSDIKVKGKWSPSSKKYRRVGISYELFRDIIIKFFEIVIRNLVESKGKVYLPNRLGYLYISKDEHKRAFHVRVDNKATKETGELVQYKVPILDDYYYKVVWVRGKKMRNCKILPLAKFKKAIKDELNKGGDF